MAIKDEAELEAVVGKDMNTAVGTFLEMLLVQNEEVVQQDVYGYPEGSVYERTGEFLHAFKKESGDGDGIASGSIDYDPTKITTISPPQHASVVDGASSADELANIIYQGNGGIWHMPPRNAYKDLDRWLTKTMFALMFEGAMTDAGIPFKRSSGGLQKEDYDEL